MEKIEYPKWKFHATKQAVIVQSKEEDEALGKEWGENPIESKPEVVVVEETIDEVAVEEKHEKKEAKVSKRSGKKS